MSEETINVNVQGVGVNQGEPVAEFNATDEQNPEATDVPEEQSEQKFFQWPENLKGDYPVRIMFTAYKLEPIQDELIESSKRKIKEMKEKGPFTPGFGNLLSEGTEEAEGTLDALSTAAGNVARAASETITSVGNLNSYENFQGGDAVGTVMLPLMRGVQYTDGVNYTQGATQTGAGIIRALTLRTVLTKTVG